MPNITRGGRMGGLLVYLAGPGRSNEHTEPHLVAGDSSLMAWHDDAELNREAALAIAAQIDKPRQTFGTTVTQPVRDKQGHKVGVKNAHVWHCSLSLRADDRALTDEQWAQVSEQFVERMGFVDNTAGQPPCRWVALRHGESAGGNDHVHLVVGLVHEDGRKANVHHDRSRAQRVAGELEREHGLQVLESREAGRGQRGTKPAEKHVAERRAREEATRAGTPVTPPPETARETLARTVRACAAAAGDEAEFVRRVRRAGVRIRPRYAAGRGDVVAGYSVAHTPPRGEAPVWYGGGHLARDLTLPRLRGGWSESPEQAAGAVAEWQAAKRNQRPVHNGPETHEPDPDLWARYTKEIAALGERLRSVPVDDRALWAHVAHETAGAFAAWSLRVEPEPGPLAATADVLARSAQLRARDVRAQRAPLPSARGGALLLASVARQGQGTAAQAILLRQLSKTARALHDCHVARGEARTAKEIADVASGQLEAVARRLPAVPEGTGVDEQAGEAARVAAQGQLPARAPGAPLPAPLEGPAPRPASSPTSPTRENEIQR